MTMDIGQALAPVLAPIIEDIARNTYQSAIEQARRDMAITREYITIPEALEYTNTARNTFTNNFIDAGLQVYRIESKQYVKKSEINQFIAKHKI